MTAPPSRNAYATDTAPDGFADFAPLPGETPASLPAALGRLHGELAAMHRGAGEIGRAISAVTDTVTRRLLALCEARLGPAPVGWAWVATGSQGRQEQTLHSDQDNALILAPDFDAARHDAYFAMLARRVNDGLAACGYRYCPGGVMAGNPRWRQPLPVWQEDFAGWARQGSRRAAMLAANFSDMRTIAGDDGLLPALQATALPALRHSETLLARLAANALELAPPLGLFGRFLTHEAVPGRHTIDLKKGGLIPIVDLARLLALCAGVAPGEGPGTPAFPAGSVARLRAAAGSAVLSEAGARGLIDAFECIGNLRVRHQNAQLARGHQPDSLLEPRRLDDSDRRELREALACIALMQANVRQRFPPLPTG
ncbi:MAG: DUF294 nucleotidyltransferase-like domain-containing protein [Proteobacteria bacterium]|nr:DUF294 nucleotidyltransferase-like domain-containing protein [Pseudomonadota bacterium]